jgi:hypothetical protein
LQPNQPDCSLVLAAAALLAGFVFLDLSAEKLIVAADKSAEEPTVDLSLVKLLSSAVIGASAMEG